MSELVTVAVVSFPHEVQMIRDRLEGEGIFVATRGEALASTGGNYLSDSAICIQVRRQDEETARQSLREVENTSARRSERPFLRILSILILGVLVRQWFLGMLPDFVAWPLTVIVCLIVWFIGNRKRVI